MREDFMWIRGIILSCLNPWQLQSCESLVTLFTIKYLYSEGMMDNRFSLLDSISEKNIEFQKMVWPDIQESL